MNNNQIILRYLYCKGIVLLQQQSSEGIVLDDGPRLRIKLLQLVSVTKKSLCGQDDYLQGKEMLVHILNDPDVLEPERNIKTQKLIIQPLEQDFKVITPDLEEETQRIQMLDAETKVIVKYYSQKERILDPTSERATKLERIKLLERGEVIIEFSAVITSSTMNRDRSREDHTEVQGANPKQKDLTSRLEMENKRIGSINSSSTEKNIEDYVGKLD
ncbi:MAG: hypothetical protein EZS28_000847 [Streblomastix strix]|uniref:Uncharacterized protein n=1 Tax=Streblomastix strix TaxID=222440 RepID=A0A5J4X8P1_9EUKA|nr:MAG: hypothetical protein EZS28_000847 [Streblomastix strix]